MVYVSAKEFAGYINLLCMSVLSVLRIHHGVQFAIDYGTQAGD